MVPGNTVSDVLISSVLQGQKEDVFLHKLREFISLFAVNDRNRRTVLH